MASEFLRKKLMVMQDRTRCRENMYPFYYAKPGTPQHQFTLLTATELEILQQAADGNNNKELAELRHITLGTIKSHFRNILTKTNTRDRTECIVAALRAGVIR